jgi:hypothetical protein
MGVDLFRANGQGGGQTGMAKLIVAFRNFANTPKKNWERSGSKENDYMCSVKICLQAEVCLCQEREVIVHPLRMIGLGNISTGKLSDLQ